MSSADETSGAPANETTLADLVNRAFVRYFGATAIIPLLFVGIDLGGHNVIPQEFASAIVRRLSFVWPTLLQQYDAISIMRGANHAANYALFVLVLLASIPMAVVYTARRYRREIRHMKMIDERDVLVLAISLLGAIYILFFDQVKESPKPVFNFSADDLGLYFIRQYALFLGGGWAAVISVFIVILRSIDSLDGDRLEESSRSVTKERD